MTVDDHIQDLLNRRKSGAGIGIERCERLFAPFRSPEFRTIRVTGSNGKGSTAAMIHAMLTGLGEEVGRYTSPHLESFHERIRLGTEDISDTALSHADEAVRQVLNCQPDTEDYGAFEVMTAVALAAFQHAGIQSAVVEAGIGGRYDPTRLMQGDLVGLTSLDLEHTQILGSSLEQIAFDKMDLAPTGGTIVALRRDRGLWERMQAYANLRGIKLIDGRRHLVKILETKLNGDQVGMRLQYLGVEFWLPLIGTFQADNFAIAATLVNLWAARHRPELEMEERLNRMQSGLSQLKWPGRFEVISQEPLAIIDVAHTPDACRRLAETVEQVLPNKRLVLVLGVSQDKAIAEILAALVPLADIIITTQAHHKGEASGRIAEIVRELRPDVQVIVTPCPTEAAQVARREATQRSLPILASGGLFLAIEFRAAWQGRDPRQLRFF
ncbi:MAG: bifunctional folylpolyglutamate synthase/dihydrofolate synthase [Fimbriiglobus sp.]